MKEDRTGEMEHHSSPSATALGTLGLVLVGGAAVHFLPGAVAWRAARCKFLPALSGVGQVDHIALTFDDGPDPRSTPRVLETVESLGWRATFFVLGSRVRQARGLTKEIVARGHEIGIHGDRHTSHLRRPATWTVPDVRRARDTVHDVTGVSPRWFRPPYGALSASSLVAARQADLQLVLWTTWGRDWRADSTGASVAAHVGRTFVPGATVLLHDSDITSACGSWKATLDTLPILAEAWHRSGLTVGPLQDHGVGEPP